MSVEELRSLILSTKQKEDCIPKQPGFCVEPKAEASWVSVKELCEKFPVLSYSKVKDRKWRDANSFPYYQEDIYYNVSYNVDDVSRWINVRKNKSPYLN